jgi:hypothetical protein
MMFNPVVAILAVALIAFVPVTLWNAFRDN